MMKKGFTLIELLIVVAIISILAAIALPNFLEAQTRAKISRTKSDLSTVGKCVMMYAVDHNRYPYDFWVPPTTEYDTWAQLTTPVSYMTSMPKDIFSREMFGNAVYDYGDRRDRDEVQQVGWAGANIDFLFFSVGPDGLTNFNWSECGVYGGEVFNAQIKDWVYDPTNGTLSSGNIIYTNRGIEL